MQESDSVLDPNESNKRGAKVQHLNPKVQENT